uniref:PUM-HD domain-containing protein n=1 Tax=Panagrellus redivivus TaxID=6233 RepID=A0A7E4ZV62_PANRE
DRIISKSLRGNIVALSQAKYSSHVMEQAFEFANYDALLQLVEEVFNGRVNTKNGRDSLNQMLFDQFGNYVIQRLLNIAIQMRHNERPGEATWFQALSDKIIENAQALLKYSSGKKIIDILSCELGYDFV